MCLTPFNQRNSSNSLEVNCGPLSDTICSGRPNDANSCLNTLITFEVVVVVISMTSDHFEWASTAIKNILSRNGPAKSMWTHCHGRAGQIHGWSGAAAGA